MKDKSKEPKSTRRRLGEKGNEKSKILTKEVKTKVNV